LYDLTYEAIASHLFFHYRHHSDGAVVWHLSLLPLSKLVKTQSLLDGLITS